jgi:hypothetical protein
VNTGLLPLHVREILKKAAKTEIPAYDPLARMRAIDHANEMVRRDYPQYFKPEPEED